MGDSGLEHNVIAYGVDGKRYPMRSEIYDGELEENLEAFMKDLNSGRVKPFVKSAPVPTSDKEPVKTLVAANFDKTLKDDSKDYLIEFYVKLEFLYPGLTVFRLLGAATARFVLHSNLNTYLLTVFKHLKHLRSSNPYIRS